MKSRTVFFSIIVCLLINIIFQVVFLSRISKDNKLETQEFYNLNSKLDKLQPVSNEKVITALTSLQDELIRYRSEIALNPNNSSTNSTQSLSESLNQTLAALTDTSVTNPYPPIVKLVKLKTGWNNVDVYSDAKASSRVLGTALTGQTYIELEKQANWYQIRLDSINNGWIQAQFIDEIN